MVPRFLLEIFGQGVKLWDPTLPRQFALAMPPHGPTASKHLNQVDISFFELVSWQVRIKHMLPGSTKVSPYQEKTS